MSQTKPIYQYFNQVRYQRHRNKLATIQNQKHEPTTINILEEAHRLRIQSLSFHQQEIAENINNQNQKLLKKLLEISKRKKSQYSQQSLTSPQIVTFNNPARKKQKLINQMNVQMAERLLTKSSFLDQKTMRKSIQDYQKTKKTMINNRRALSQVHAIKAPLPSITKKVEQKSVKYKKKHINFEIQQQDNPQYHESKI